MDSLNKMFEFQKLECSLENRLFIVKQTRCMSEYILVSRIFDSSYVLGCGRDFKFAV